MLAGCTAAVVACGHTHAPMVRRRRGATVNPKPTGGVDRPFLMWISPAREVADRLRKWYAIALLLAVALVAPAPALAQGNVQLNVTVGFEGRIKPGSWAPLTVEILNGGPELAGELVWDYRPEWGAAAPYTVRHSLPVSLPAGARKRYTVYAPTGSGGGGPEVRLMGRSGELASQKAVLRHTTDALVGLLGPDREDLAPLAALQLPNGQNMALVRLDAATLPDRAQALRSLDVLVIGRFSADELTEEQRQALRDWVRDGGLLVLAGGPEAHRTLAPWLPWVPLELQGQAQSDLTPLAEWTGAAAPGATAAVSRAEVRDARVLAADGDLPLVATWVRGRGSVAYLAFDPTLEPVHGWAGGTRMWERLIQSGGLAGLYEAGPDREMMFWQSLARSAQILPVDTLPSLDGLKITLLAYVLLLGPVSFLVLRRLRRAEWAWITTPLLVLLFAGGTWYQSRLQDTARLMAHQVSVVELGGGEAARVRTMLGVFVPAQHTTRVSFDRPMPLQTAVPDGRYRGGSGDLPVGVNLHGGGTGPVDILPLGMWTMRAVGGTSSAPVGELVADLALSGTNLTGTVTNGTGVPLEDVVVAFGANFDRLGDLAPGAAAPVQLSISGNDMEMRPEQLFHAALRRVIDSGRFDPRVSEGERERVRRMNLIDALAQARPAADRPVVLGWADWTPGGVQINGETFSPYSTAVFLQSADLAVSAGPFTIPAGVVQARPVAWEGNDYGYGPAGWGIPGQGAVTVEFSLPVAAAAVEHMDLHVPVYEQPTRAGSITVEFWDWQARSWEEHPFDGRLAAASNPQPLIGPGDTVRARLSRTGQEGFGTGIPSLAVSGTVK